MSEPKETITKNKKKKSGGWLTFLAIILAVVGVILIFEAPIRNIILSSQVNNYAKIGQTISVEEVQQNEKVEATYNFEDINSASLQSVLEASLNKAKVPVIGQIAIPSVSINLSIAKGVTDLNMLVGAGTLREDQVMGEGNYPLASHNVLSAGGENLLFSPLSRTKIGDKIYLTDVKHVYEYKIISGDYYDENRVDLTYDVPGETLVTLITCDSTATKRYIVRGSLESVTTLEEASQEVKDAFKRESLTL